MDLFLFTNFFPYKRSEPFLLTEFEHTQKFARTITVFTLYGELQDVRHVKEAELLHPLLPSPDQKFKLLYKGLSVLAPFGEHLRELFSAKLIVQPKKLYWLSVSTLLTRIALSSSSYRKLIKKIDASAHPVLYFYWSDNLTSIIPYLVKRTKKKIKIVIRFHGSDLYENIKSNYAPLRVDLEHATLLCPVSENGAIYLKNKYPSEAHKIFVARLGAVDHGLNPEVNPADFISHKIISVSNVVAIKRVHLIFEALQHCSLNIIWHHFGDGPLLADLKAITKAHRPGLKIIWHGHVSNDILIEFFKSHPASLFINTSSSEGLPVSIMEALSFGIPVVATDVGGVGELVNEKVGALLPPAFETKTLSEIIEQILMLNPEKTAIIRNNARRAFLEKVHANKNYEEFYARLLSL